MDALTKERRNALGSLITNWLSEQDLEGRVLDTLDYFDVDKIDELIDEAIAPAIADAVAVAIAAIPSDAAQAPVVRGTDRVNLDGWQLLEALNYLAPDRDTDPEQLNGDVTIQFGNGHSGEALYCWSGEYPDDGAFVLDGSTVDRETITAPVAPAAAAPSDTWKQIREINGGGALPITASFQSRVQPWLMECFGPMIAGDREERNHRFLEESLELVQACGCTASDARQLVDYVFGRPVGEPHQEVGGVMVTLAALCLANGLDMHSAAETELARIWTKVEQIRAKQAAKPKHSPLPEVAPTPTVAADAAAPSHPDDEAVERFASAMKEKLAQARAKGRGGWEQCEPSALSDMLREHVEKGDPRDVANFCAFLWNLKQPIGPCEQHMSNAEIEQFLRMDEQFSDCNETDVDHSLLLKWARDGLLDCTHYEVTDKGNAVIRAARKAEIERIDRCRR